MTKVGMTVGGMALTPCTLGSLTSKMALRKLPSLTWSPSGSGIPAPSLLNRFSPSMPDHPLVTNDHRGAVAP